VACKPAHNNSHVSSAKRLEIPALKEIHPQWKMFAGCQWWQDECNNQIKWSFFWSPWWVLC